MCIDWFRTLLAYPSDLWKDGGLIYTIPRPFPTSLLAGIFREMPDNNGVLVPNVASILTHPPLCFPVIPGDPSGHSHMIYDLGISAPPPTLVMRDKGNL